MPKPKPSKPILKLVPPSPWLQKAVNGIEYWVHKPSRKGGIHIRGLARLCGVKENAIRSAIRNAKKEEGCEAVFKLNCVEGTAELRENYGFSSSDISRIKKIIQSKSTHLCMSWRKIHGQP